MELSLRIPQAHSPVLVTGGAGFIGSHLVDRLLSSGRRVVVIDDFNDFYDPTIKRNNIQSHLENSNYTLIEGDIRDIRTLERVFEEHAIGEVVHLAARAGVRPSLEQPFLYESTNITGTLNILENCRKKKVGKLVFGSSSSVYGINEKVPFSESDPIPSPISPYAATKAAGELLCHTYSHLYDLNTVCLRFFTVYGPRQRPDLAIHKFAKMISEGRSIPVFGDGSTERDYTFVDDIVDGIVAALGYQGTTYEVFNLGNSRTVSLARLIEVLEATLGKKAIIERFPLQPGDVPRTYADTTKSANLIDFHPKTTIEEGIARFVSWFESNRTSKV